MGGRYRSAQSFPNGIAARVAIRRIALAVSPGPRLSKRNSSSNEVRALMTSALDICDFRKNLLHMLKATRGYF